MAGLAAKVYGEALFEIALENKTEEKFYREAGELSELWGSHPELRQLLNAPETGIEKQMEILEHIFKDRISPDILGLLLLLVKKGRQSEILDVLEAFKRSVRSYKNLGTATVTSAVELNVMQRREVEKQILKTFGFSDCEICFKVDPSLIGGMVILAGDKVVDGSIRTQIEGLAKKLGGKEAVL